MFLRLMYDDALAAGTYLVGCQRSGEAIVIDPQRDVDRYIAAATAAGLRIVAAAETHVHADFLSGVRALHERVGAAAYVSGEGGDEWRVRWLDDSTARTQRPSRRLRDGDMFHIGEIEFRVVHTPGHTPEHIAYLATDRGGGATEPMGLFSGDFLFVGDLGRPDLLEAAVGVSGAALGGARALYRSVRRTDALPDWLQVWPAHGAGSACGKALGAVPQTTLGYERRWNPALRAAADEAAFVASILAGQPEPPRYFARMKRENVAGPRPLPDLPRPARLDAAALAKVDAAREALIDTRPWAAFRSGHVPGALFHPVNTSFVTDVGSMIEPDEPITLIIDPARLEEAVRMLVRIGLDDIRGWVDPSDLESYERAGGRLVPTPELRPDDARALAAAPTTYLLDVRRASEFAEGHLPGAANVAHTRLRDRLADLPRSRHILVNCRSGGRSARACALLQRAGFEVTNLGGGMLAWEESRGAVER